MDKKDILKNVYDDFFGISKKKENEELNFDKAEFCAKSGAYFLYVSIFKQNSNAIKIVIIFQPFPP